MMRKATSLPSGRVTKWAILALWIALLIPALMLAGKLGDVQKNDNSAWLPSNAEATKVVDQAKKFQPAETLPAIVIYDRPEGITPADMAKAQADAEAFKGIKDVVGQPQGPLKAQDGKAIQTVVQVHKGKENWSGVRKAVDAMNKVGEQNANGLGFHVTGPAGNASDSAKAFKGIDGTLLYSTIAVVVVILLLTYRSPVLWLLPVISAGVALTTAQGVVYLLAKYAGLTVNAQSAGILTVLVFGAGTDYALLLVARYREELRKHADRHEAMAVALHRAGPAIIASAATVVVGMLCLLVAETNSTKGLGQVTAVGILVGLGVMLTLLPALLVIMGRWIFWPARPTLGSREPTTTGLWAKVGNRIARRPRRTWVVTTLVLVAMALGLSQLDAGGLSNAESFRGHPDSIVGAQVLARHFPAGAGSPVVVVADAGSAQAVRAAFAATSGIDAASVTPPMTKNGHAYLQGTLNAAPDSQAAFDTVDRVRANVHAVAGAHAQVGGNTAINLDVRRAAQHDRNLIIPVVLAVVLVILMLLLRSLVAPLLLLITVVLSFAAALGASALVFRHGFGWQSADTSFPLFVFVFLVALGIDYNIFLMTRVREEAQRHDARRGALIGLTATGGVITSAGLVLAGTFAVLATLPVTAFAEIGFAVAFGVLLDTIVVRAVLVTALNIDVGRFMWWPGALYRRQGEVIAEPEAREAAPVTA